jgi:hypothetical protein
MVTSADVIALQTAIQAHVPTFIWGGPGIGKTAVTEAIARVLDEPIWTVILSIREPSDQGGLPRVTPEGVTMEPPMWAKQLHKSGHGIVFMDEFNGAPPTTQSSALRVVHGGWAGDLKLPEATSFVAAGNPPEISTGVYDLTSAIANRWCHFDFPLDPNAWCDGMVKGWPDTPARPLPKDWRNGISAKRGNVSSFIRVRSELLYDCPEDPAAQGRAWQSPRTWDMSALLLAAAASIGYTEKSEVARKLVAGCVGVAAQREFTNWFVKLDLRDPKEYLLDPRKTPLPRRQDQIMATLDSVASAALDRGPKRKQQIGNYESAWIVLGRVARGTDKGGMGMPDIVIPAARILAPAMPDELDNKIPPEVDDVWPILEEAGIDFGPDAS